MQNVMLAGCMIMQMNGKKQPDVQMKMTIISALQVPSSQTPSMSKYIMPSSVTR